MQARKTLRNPQQGFARSSLLSLIAIAVVVALAIPAYSALQGNTTASNVSGEDNRTRSIVAGDVNGDTFIDLIVANEDNFRNQIFFGDGAGNFGAGVNLDNLLENTDSVDLADIDGDLDLDLVLGNRLNAHPNRVYRNDGNGVFSEVSTSISDITAFPDRVTSMVKFADLNANNDPDVIVVNRNKANRVFYGNPGAGAIGFPTNAILSGTATFDSSSVAVGDLDKDGLPDLVIGNRRNIANSIHFNTGAGFTSHSPLSSDTNYTDWVDIADLDNDGNLDVITGNKEQPNLYLLGNGDGTFQNAKTISLDADYTRDIRAVDVDGDGDLDIVTANNSVTRNKLYLNLLAETGVLGFSDSISLTTDQHESISVAVCGPANGCDLDGDGDTDLIFGNNENVNRVNFDNNEDPAFSSTPILGATDGVVYTYTVEAQDADQGQTLTMTGPGPAWLGLTDNGDRTWTLSGTPGAADVGVAQNVALSVSDGSLSAAQNFAIAVAAAGTNTAPTISSGTPPATIQQGTGNAPYAYAITTTDAEGGALLITAPTLPNWMAIADAGDGTGSLSGQPGPGDLGAHNVRVRVTDSAGAAGERAFVVTVTDGNDRPIANDDNIQISQGATAVTLGPNPPDYEATSVLWNDTDADGDTLTASLTTPPVNGTVTFLNANGTFEYVHDNTATTTDSFRYRASDGNGGNIQATVNIFIGPQADTTPPVITIIGDDSVNLTMGDVYADAGATAADDIDGDITASIVTVDPVDTATLGVYIVTYNVSDNAGNAAEEVTRMVTVNAPDTTAPVITLLGNATVTLTVGDSYTDAGATATDDTDGDITAEIDTNNPVDAATQGTYTVTYNVMDDAGNAATEVTRTVTVEAVVVPPPPPPPKKKGGGAASGLGLLGLMFLVVMSRRRMRLIRRSI